MTMPYAPVKNWVPVLKRLSLLPQRLGILAQRLGCPTPTFE